MIGSAVSEPPPRSIAHAGRALQQARVQVEDVARIGLAARRAAQQQRHLAIRPGVLGEIVVDDQRVPAVLHELFAHGSCRQKGAMYCRAAGSDAEATTTIVLSIAPYSSSVRTTWAIWACFWPIAT